MGALLLCVCLDIFRLAQHRGPVNTHTAAVLYYLAGLMRHSLLVLLLLTIAAGASGQEQHAVATDSVKGGLLHIRHIIIEGNKVTRAQVLLRELDIHAGDMLHTDSVTQVMAGNKLKLFNLQLFNEVEQRIVREGEYADWYIHVKERWYIIPVGTVQFADRNLNTWLVKHDHDLRRVTAGVTITDINFRGNLENLAVTVQGGFTQKLGLSYMRPYINKAQTHGVGISASVAQSRQAYFATINDKLVFAGDYDGPVVWRQAEAGLTYLYRPAYAARHYAQVTYKSISVGDTIVKLNPEYFAGAGKSAKFIELFYRVDYNGVDNWNYPLKGVKMVTQVVTRYGFEGINFQGYIQEEAGLFLNPLSRCYVALIARGRIMYPRGQPYFFRGGLGMQRDQVRGYEYYVTDGYSYALGRLDLKRELFNRTFATGIKYFSAIPVRIYPKLFVDAGYIDGARQFNNTLPNRLLYSIGAGLDIVTLYDVKIRIEFAHNHLGQNGLYLHFNSE
ncbi:MAG: POTRA domain-containing protein [Bacteroidota bacterium]